MNIFHLHKDPKICAEYHCDKHVVKMILETGQMLSTAYQRHCGIDEDLYKPAYQKHPMTIWVGDSQANYLWTMDLLGELINQYRYRYNNKTHSTGRILNNLLLKNKNVIDKFKYKSFLIPPLCMPDHYKVDNYIQSYINYYVGDKKRFAKYTRVDTPSFMC
ncbi:MAG: hypothetical protein ACO3UU_01430 [Minisyncoccia bacterium]